MPVVWSIWGTFRLPVGTEWLLGLLIFVTLLSFLADHFFPSQETHSLAPSRFRKTFFVFWALASFLPVYYAICVWAPSDVDCMTNAFQATQIKLYGTFPIVPCPALGEQAEVFITYPPGTIFLIAFLSGLLRMDTAALFLINGAFCLCFVAPVLFVFARRLFGRESLIPSFAPLVALPQIVYASFFEDGDLLEIHGHLVAMLCFFWCLEFVRDFSLRRALKGGILLAGLFFSCPLNFNWIGFALIAHGILMLFRRVEGVWRKGGLIILALLVSVLLVAGWLLLLPPNANYPGVDKSHFWELFRVGFFARVSTYGFAAVALLGFWSLFRNCREWAWFFLTTLLLWIGLIEIWTIEDPLIEKLLCVPGANTTWLRCLLDNCIIAGHSLQIILPFLVLSGLWLLWRLLERWGRIGTTVMLIVALGLWAGELRRRTGAPLINYCDWRALEWLKAQPPEKKIVLVNLQNTPLFVGNWAPVIAERSAVCWRARYDYFRKDPHSEWTCIFDFWTTFPPFDGYHPLSGEEPILGSDEAKTSAEYLLVRNRQILDAVARLEEKGSARRLLALGCTHLFVPSGIPASRYFQSECLLQKCFAAESAGHLRRVFFANNDDLAKLENRRVTAWEQYDKKSWIFEILPEE